MHIIGITHTHNSTYTFLAESSDQFRQLQQVLEPERAAPGSSVNEGIDRPDTGPSGRQGAQSAIVVVEEGTRLAPAEGIVNQVELAADQRMERVRYAELLFPETPDGCS